MHVSPPQLGFIGLGLMGAPMAGHLRASGAMLNVYNRSANKAAGLQARGCRWCDSPRAVAAVSDLVFIMVADTPAVEQVLFGKQGVAQGLRRDSVVVDMGTTAVSATYEFAQRIQAQGGHYVDAPVSGGELGAQQASLSIMVGGSAAAFMRALPYFKILGNSVTHVGDTGAGQVAKAANQVIVGLNIGAVAEALTLAKRAGVDPEKVCQALSGGFADSRVLQVHGQRMCAEHFVPGAKSTTQLKDLQQALELATSLKLELPATALCQRLYQHLLNQGWGSLDHSALIKLIDGATGEAKFGN